MAGYESYPQRPNGAAKPAFTPAANEDNAFGYDRKMMGAPNQVINVALEPTSPHCGCTPGNCSCGPECGCMCCYGNGPGGKTTIIQYNEKGILESGLHHVIGMTTEAHLTGYHDDFAQGIYAHPPTPYDLDD